VLKTDVVSETSEFNLQAPIQSEPDIKDTAQIPELDISDTTVTGTGLNAIVTATPIDIVLSSLWESMVAIETDAIFSETHAKDTE
jgi:hypothetical protein